MTRIDLEKEGFAEQDIEKILLGANKKDFEAESKPDPMDEFE